MHAHLRGALIPVLAITTVIVLGACKDETAPETHHPESVRLFDATTGAELTPNVQLPSSATTRVGHDANADELSSGPFTVTATVNMTGLQAPVARVHR